MIVMRYFLLLIFFILNVGLSAQSIVSHDLFTEILQQYVNEDGWVDYRGLGENRKKLDDYLSILKRNHPEENWDREMKLAYWINAYNAFTLHLILEKYPIESIKDIGSWIQIPFVNTPWDIKFIEIEDNVYDLNNIEHDILRKDFDEPRIHFAIVCASYSCPRLNRTAYTAERIEQQLEAAAYDFLNDPRKNKLSTTAPQISKIFSWFGGDFKKGSSLIEFVNRYADMQIDKDADISYLDYNWALNDQQTLD